MNPATFLIGALTALMTTFSQAGEPPKPFATRDSWVHGLGLELLPGESGRFVFIGASKQGVRDDSGREFPAQSQIYYLLDRDLPLNYLHWLASDDTHVLIDGGPVDYYIFHPDGHAERVRLGRDLSQGERRLVAVPGGAWKALVLVEEAEFALMANALSPAWTPDRVKIGAGQAFLSLYLDKAEWASEAFLRKVIGPNFHTASDQNAHTPEH